MSDNQTTTISKQEGISENGNLQEALEDAISKVRPSPYFSWRLLEVTGEVGGIANSKSVKVSIESSIQ